MLASVRIRKPFIFAVMREPVSWVESWYRFRSRDELAPPEHPQHHNYTGNMEFSEFVEAVLLPRAPSYARINSQFHYISGNDGSVGIDKIIPLDLVDEEVPKLLQRFNITVSNPKDRRNVSAKRDAGFLSPALESKLLDHLHHDVRLYNDSFSDISK